MKLTEHQGRDRRTIYRLDCPECGSQTAWTTDDDAVRHAVKHLAHRKARCRLNKARARLAALAKK